MKKLMASAAITCVATQVFAAGAEKTPQQPKALSASNGRYVFGQISEFRRDQYMLDTQTGRAWKIIMRPYKDKDGADLPGDGFPVFDIVPYVDIEGKLSVTPK